jgi:hypothetical protein
LAELPNHVVARAAVPDERHGCSRRDRAGRVPTQLAVVMLPPLNATNLFKIVETGT